ncbi:phosphate ABC transporter permease [Halorubrum sp. Ea1]|uniref:phosphate ABC transporter permease n=1 Tax=Halorubrum sp. Ea1 TaxID=1480718 RepID=UPI000B998043|nr:phosphate ABC transporter permease [Halorubrum sp. Ea1]OYR52982.1 phosphate ABC transporter permease [Halorubrum sp. Ea1]
MSSPTGSVSARAASPGALGRFGGRVGAIGLLVAVATGVATAVRVLYNAPFEPAALPPRLVPVVGTVAALAAGVALAAVALSTRRSAVRVGLLFAGVFGVLATISGSATVAAAVAIPGGAALAFARALGVPATYFELRRGALALAFALAVGLSLVATAGIVGSAYRVAGSVAFLAGVTLLAVRAERDRVALGAGAFAFAGVVAASAAAPFVTGSALLVGFAVVGIPSLLVATAAFGGVAAAVAGLRDGDARLAIGAVLLLAAGVPATPGAATAVCLGAALVALDADEPFGAQAGNAPDSTDSREVSAR